MYNTILLLTKKTEYSDIWNAFLHGMRHNVQELWTCKNGPVFLAHRVVYG